MKDGKDGGTDDPRTTRATTEICGDDVKIDGNAPKKPKRKKKSTGREVPDSLKSHVFTSDQDMEQARINGAKGGRAAAENKRRRKNMAETLEILLNMPLHPGPSRPVEESECMSEAEDHNPTAGEMMAIAQIRRAIKGDTRAFEAVLAVLGDMNKTTVSPLEGLADALKAYTEPKKAEDNDGDSTPDE